MAAVRGETNFAAEPQQAGRNTHMYDFQSAPKAVKRCVSMVGTAWREFAATFVNSNFGAVVAFSSIGLLIAINLILRFPDASTLIMEYNLF
jgi:hypothetical protein